MRCVHISFCLAQNFDAIRLQTQYFLTVAEREIAYAAWKQRNGGWQNVDFCASPSDHLNRSISLSLALPSNEEAAEAEFGLSFRISGKV